MALLVGLLIGLGRLSADRESVALLACGVSPYRLLRPILVLAAVAGGGHHVGDDRRHPGREPDIPARSPSRCSRKKVESDVQPRVFFDEFPELGAVSARRSRAGAARLEGRAGRRHLEAGRRELYHGPPRPDGARPRSSGTVELVLTDGTSTRPRKPGEIRSQRFRQDADHAPRPEDASFRRST